MSDLATPGFVRPGDLPTVADPSLEHVGQEFGVAGGRGRVVGLVIPAAGTGDPRPGGPDDRLLFWPEVKGMTGLSRSTVWRMQKVGEFPASVQVSRGRVGWWESELTAWKRARTPHRLPEARPFDPPPVRQRSNAANALAGPPAEVADISGASQIHTDPETEPSRRRSRRPAVPAGQIAFDFGA